MPRSKKLKFISISDALQIYRGQMEQFGGSYGIRDRGLLESALAMPQVRFGGKYLHENLFDMAAAYLYHIVKNHPFVDGNKRTGSVITLLFLKTNGIELEYTQKMIYELACKVATSEIAKEEIAQYLKKQAH